MIQNSKPTEIKSSPSCIVLHRECHQVCSLAEVASAYTYLYLFPPFYTNSVILYTPYLALFICSVLNDVVWALPWACPGFLPG